MAAAAALFLARECHGREPQAERPEPSRQAVAVRVEALARMGQPDLCHHDLAQAVEVVAAWKEQWAAPGRAVPLVTVVEGLAVVALVLAVTAVTAVTVA